MIGVKSVFQVCCAFLVLSACSASVCLTPNQHQMSALDPRTQSYCGTAINWSISTATLDSYATYDARALADYTVVYNKWVASGGSNNSNPTNDCLGVLRNILCAYYYPYCDRDTGDSVRVCQWYCDYLLDRCPDETDLYSQICSNPPTENCAFSRIIAFTLALALALFAFL